MISRFIAVPQSVNLLTRCASITPYSTKRGMSEHPTQQPDPFSLDVRKNAIENGVKKEPLPNYPRIEGIREMTLEAFSVSNLRQVKYGDYEFTECKEGYVQVHIKGWCDARNPCNRVATYGICYGKDHPLNSSGRVIGKQTLHHANTYAVAGALKSLPTSLFTKVCICTDSTYVLWMMTRYLRKWSENNYRMRSHPETRVENLPTVKFINEYVRLNPFTYRFKYTPSDCFISMMRCATKLAKEECFKLTH